MPKKVLICDDEKDARSLLAKRMSDFTDYKVIGEASTGEETVDAIKRLNPDLVLLDIEMPRSTGLEVVEQIGIDNMPPTIFVTAYSEFAIKAFELYAVDYLLKPFTKERFETAIKRVEKRISSDNNQNKADLKKLFDYLSSKKIKNGTIIDTDSKYLQRITVESVLPHVILECEKIELFTAEDHYVRLYTNNRNFLIPAKISDLESQLDPTRFCRVHRSQIVNLSKVSKLKNGSFGTLELLMESGKKVKVSRNRKNQVQLAMVKWE